MGMGLSWIVSSFLCSFMWLVKFCFGLLPQKLFPQTWQPWCSVRNIKARISFKVKTSSKRFSTYTLVYPNYTQLNKTRVSIRLLIWSDFFQKLDGHGILPIFRYNSDDYWIFQELDDHISLVKFFKDLIRILFKN